MLSKQIFELFQVSIFMAAFAKSCIGLLFPCRPKLLQRIPVPAQVFSFFFRFERSSGSRSIPVNTQLRKPGCSLRLIQCPGNFVFGCGSRLATVRHNEHRRGPGSQVRAENGKDKVVLARVKDLLATLRVPLGGFMFLGVGAQQKTNLLGFTSWLRSFLLSVLSS